MILSEFIKWIQNKYPEIPEDDEGCFYYYYDKCRNVEDVDIILQTLHLQFPLASIFYTALCEELTIIYNSQINPNWQNVWVNMLKSALKITLIKETTELPKNIVYYHPGDTISILRDDKFTRSEEEFNNIVKLLNEKFKSKTEKYDPSPLVAFADESNFKIAINGVILKTYINKPDIFDTNLNYGSGKSLHEIDALVDEYKKRNGID